MYMFQYMYTYMYVLYRNRTPHKSDTVSKEKRSVNYGKTHKRVREINVWYPWIVCSMSPSLNPLRDYKSLPEDEPTFYDFRKNEEVAKAGFKDNYSTIIFRWTLTSLADPDPYPDPYPYVFGLRILILLSSSKTSWKNLDSYCFVTSLWLFIFEKWCKCTPSGSNKQKN